MSIQLTGNPTKIYSDFDGEFEIFQLEPGFYRTTLSLLSYQETHYDIYVDKASKESYRFEIIQ